MAVQELANLDLSMNDQRTVTNRTSALKMVDSCIIEDHLKKIRDSGRIADVDVVLRHDNVNVHAYHIL